MNGIRHQRGFTLVEVILAIVLFAMSMAAILPLLDRAFLLSYEPGAQLADNLALQSAMEELVLWHTNGLEALRLHVGSEGGLFQDQFTVLENRYVFFSNQQEFSAAGTNFLLKITLVNDLGEWSTRLFTVPL